MKIKKIILVIIVTLIVYSILPLIAGVFKIGNRNGPIIYPLVYHSNLYIISYEALHNENPRETMVSVLYNRPLFYGLKDRPKSKEERNKILEKISWNNKDYYDFLVLENNEIDKLKSN